jgi:hypothetical protein
MGRVSRYKKFNDIDPTARADLFRGSTKQGRLSKKSRATFDAEVQEEDDFEIVDGKPVFKKKKLAKKSKKDAFDEALDSYTEEQQEKISKSLDRSSLIGGLKNVYKPAKGGTRSDKILSGGTGKVGETKKLFESRGAEESMRAFNKRIKNETSTVLAASMKKAGTSERKKNYLAERKKAKKEKKMNTKRKRGDESSDDEGDLRDTREGDEDFGVQVERPPEFKVVPKDRRKEMAKLLRGGEEEEEESEADAFRRRQELKKKNEMAELSKKVQEAYKAMKASKRNV